MGVFGEFYGILRHFSGVFGVLLGTFQTFLDTFRHSQTQFFYPNTPVYLTGSVVCIRLWRAFGAQARGQHAVMLRTFWGKLFKNFDASGGKSPSFRANFPIRLSNPRPFLMSLCGNGLLSGGVEILQRLEIVYLRHLDTVRVAAGARFLELLET